MKKRNELQEKGKLLETYKKMNWAKYLKYWVFYICARRQLVNVYNEQSVIDFDNKLKQAQADFENETKGKTLARDYGADVWQKAMKRCYPTKTYRVQTLTGRVLGFTAARGCKLYLSNDIDFIADYVSSYRYFKKKVEGNTESRSKIKLFLDAVAKIRPNIVVDSDKVTVDGMHVEEYKNEFNVIRYRLKETKVDLSYYINYEKNPYKDRIGDGAGKLIKKITR